MQSAPLPANEADRLRALESYRILDTAPESVFDDITAIAAQICGTPIALISLVDEHRQWFKARTGMERRETPRSEAFCAHVILSPGMMVVPDAHLDSRFSDNPLVTGDPHVRFYAGASLTAPDGHDLGTLCVIDHEPRTLTSTQLAALEALSRQVIALLELRRVSATLASALKTVRILSKLIPICAYCKRVRDDKAYWSELGEYLGEHTGTALSHGICPACVTEHFPHT